MQNRKSSLETGEGNTAGQRSMDNNCGRTLSNGKTDTHTEVTGSRTGPYTRLETILLDRISDQ